MGTIQHDFAVAVISFNNERGLDAFEKVKAYAQTLGEMDVPQFSNFESLLIGPIHSIANFTDTYFMAPDGSKEGWETSDTANEIRRAFVEKMHNAGARVFIGSFGEMGSSFSVKE